LAENLSQLTSGELELTKAYTRRRVFLFAYVVSAIAFLSTLTTENEHQLFLVDDYGKIVFSIVMIVIIVATWRTQTLASMKRTNQVGTVAGVLTLVFGVMALVIERGNSDAIADDFPAIILGIFFIINGVA
jgi:hypothetical protein